MVLKGERDSLPAFLLILSIAAAGFAGVGVWGMLAGSLALHLTVADKYQHLFRQAQTLGKEKTVLWGWAASIAQSLIAGGGAYMLGRVVAFLMLESS